MVIVLVFGSVLGLMVLVENDWVVVGLMKLRVV